MLRDVQELLAQACRQREPDAWLRDRLAGALPGTLTEAERDMLLAADADGLRLTRLLMQKLRLQRLLLGDPRAAADLAADEAAFVARFERYCERVPPTAVFPSDEAAAFRAFEER